MRGIFRLRSLEIVWNGEVVARAQANRDGRPSSSRNSGSTGKRGSPAGLGVDNHLDEWGRPVFAHTSPVYVACGGDWAMADHRGPRYIRTLSGAREYVRHTAVRRGPAHHHHHGQPDHLAWLERPFDEALRALDERGRGTPD